MRLGQVLESQRFIMGPQVRELEAEVASLVGCKFALGCASGSDALLLALMALDIDSGDEVITQPFTFIATAGSIARLKAKPVFVDIDPETYNLDARQLQVRHYRQNPGDHAGPSLRAAGRHGRHHSDRQGARCASHRGCRPGNRLAVPWEECGQHRRVWLLQLLPVEESGRSRWMAA